MLIFLAVAGLGSGCTRYDSWSSFKLCDRKFAGVKIEDLFQQKNLKFSKFSEIKYQPV